MQSKTLFGTSIVYVRWFDYTHHHNRRATMIIKWSTSRAQLTQTIRHHPPPGLDMWNILTSESTATKHRAYISIRTDPRLDFICATCASNERPITMIMISFRQYMRTASYYDQVRSQHILWALTTILFDMQKLRGCAVLDMHVCIMNQVLHVFCRIVSKTHIVTIQKINF